jgi:hypothetical protein
MELPDEAQGVGSENVGVIGTEFADDLNALLLQGFI